MIKQLKYFSILFIALITSSCNSQSQTKSSIVTNSNRENLVNKKIEPIEYGAGDVVTEGFSDKEGNIWFTTTREGIYKYNGKTFTNITVKGGLCDSNVACFYEDELGLIWIGMGDGVCYYDGKNFISFNNGGQSLEDIRFIIKDTKKVICGRW